MISNIDKILNDIKSSFSDLETRLDKYGELYSIALFDNMESYQFDITKSEIGLTYRTPSDIDFSGSDISFKDINLAIEFLINYRLKNNKHPL